MSTEKTRETPSPQRILLEDALRHLYVCEEASTPATIESLAGALAIDLETAARTFAKLRENAWVTAHGPAHQLTPAGRDYSLRILRGHRIYETYLARKTSTPATDWHRKAHTAEHLLAPDEVESLAKTLNNPRYDPHGDPIPTADGRMPSRVLTTLSDWPSGTHALIEHLEDEPETIFTELEKLGLAPGTQLLNPQQNPDGSITATFEGREILISAPMAALIQVATLPEEQVAPADIQTLSDVPLGATVTIHSLSPSCIGPERHRLLDLGLVPGTRVHCELTSPFNGPRAYLIRGALIALRDYQARRILVHPAP